MTNIKVDAPTQIQKLSVDAQLLENELMSIKSSRTRANQAVLNFKKQLQLAALDIEKKTDSQKDRADYLTHAIFAAEKEKERLNTKLRQLEHECENQKEKYEQQVEAMQYQAHEVETQLKSKIQVTLHHLRGLKEFQEHKHQMDEQMKTVSHLLAKEKKDRAHEQSLIHKKLQAQREYYERQLTDDLAQADAFANEFEDLHLDLVTTKILHETEAKREALKSENALTLDVLKKNDQLRHQVQSLEQQKKLLSDSEKTLTSQAIDLKAKLEDVKSKVDESILQSKQKLEDIRSKMNVKINELTNRYSDVVAQNEDLKKQIALAQKTLDDAECMKNERQRKQRELLSVMNEAAIFVLTSLELQEKDPTKDEIVSHSSGLNAVIRKLANVSQEMSGVERKQKSQNELGARADKKLLSVRKAAGVKNGILTLTKGTPIIKKKVSPRP